MLGILICGKDFEAAGSGFTWATNIGAAIPGVGTPCAGLRVQRIPANFISTDLLGKCNAEGWYFYLWSEYNPRYLTSAMDKVVTVPKVYDLYFLCIKTAGISSDRQSQQSLKFLRE